jgi:hypothetical protein
MDGEGGRMNQREEIIICGDPDEGYKMCALV